METFERQRERQRQKSDLDSIRNSCDVLGDMYGYPRHSNCLLTQERVRKNEKSNTVLKYLGFSAVLGQESATNLYFRAARFHNHSVANIAGANFNWLFEAKH